VLISKMIVMTMLMISSHSHPNPQEARKLLLTGFMLDLLEDFIMVKYADDAISDTHTFSYLCLHKEFINRWITLCSCDISHRPNDGHLNWFPSSLFLVLVPGHFWIAQV
jgi:hypothetical protein